MDFVSIVLALCAAGAFGTRTQAGSNHWFYRLTSLACFYGTSVCIFTQMYLACRPARFICRCGFGIYPPCSFLKNSILSCAERCGSTYVGQCRVLLTQSSGIYFKHSCYPSVLKHPIMLTGGLGNRVGCIGIGLGKQVRKRE